MKRLPADKWFSLCVREAAAWVCQRCGKDYSHDAPTQALHCAHVPFGRHKWSTRFHADNALALCMGCHRHVDTRDRDEGRRIQLGRLGESRYEALELLSNQPAKGIKQELRDIAQHYRKEYEVLLAKRADGEQGELGFISYQ